MVDFVSEVQEELRKDDYNLWLRKYGPFVFAIIIVVILATAYLEFRKDKVAAEAESYSYTYLEAAEFVGTDDEKAVGEFLALSENAPAGYAGLSLMRASALEFERGNTDKAVELLDRSTKVFELKRHQQYAQMKAAYILLADGRFSDVIARVTPLSARNEPFEFLALELLAISALQQGDNQIARKHFTYLDTIPGVPPNIKLRAKQNLLLMRDPATADEPAKELHIQDIEPVPADETPTETQENE
ncbi:MAG: tetratricopeptide repeat protein [Hellea sp.]|nr:tetratricopeptide repeat protein [Hellea sp.]